MERERGSEEAGKGCSAVINVFVTDYSLTPLAAARKCKEIFTSAQCLPFKSRLWLNAF